MGSGMPPTSFCTLQPYNSVPTGKMTKIAGRLALNLSWGRRSPLRLRMYLFTV